MNKRKVVLLDQKDSAWFPFLGEYFEDSSSDFYFFHEVTKFNTYLDSQFVDIVFVTSYYLNLTLAQKLKIFRQSRPDLRIFHLGKLEKNPHDITFDEIFVEPLSLSMFQKQLVQRLPLPESIRVLLIDDEQEILTMMRDYLDNRTHPTFEIHHAENGLKGLERLKKDKFEVIVLDVKMPEMNGREVYREIKAQKIPIPVIIFFDAIFGDEMVEIHQYGHPAVVEKGARASAMPDMAALIKKMVFFG